MRNASNCRRASRFASSAIVAVRTALEYVLRFCRLLNKKSCRKRAAVGSEYDRKRQGMCVYVYVCVCVIRYCIAKKTKKQKRSRPLFLKISFHSRRSLAQTEVGRVSSRGTTTTVSATTVRAQIAEFSFVALGRAPARAWSRTGKNAFVFSFCSLFLLRNERK